MNSAVLERAAQRCSGRALHSEWRCHVVCLHRIRNVRCLSPHYPALSILKTINLLSILWVPKHMQSQYHWSYEYRRTRQACYCNGEWDGGCTYLEVQMIDSAICAERIEGQPEVRVIGFVSKLQC